ncbi:MAG: ABC transporter substrate-binding protein [Firmicutes bacterium]|nr:ABC transporter substrate-binding protein [Bacillota bacterium]
MFKRIFSAKKFVCLSAVVILLAAALCCCTEKDKNTGASETVTFKDALDRTVTVKKNPERVASLLGSFADTWIAAGGTLCAAAEDAWDDFGLNLPNAVNLGGAHSPSLEILLSADPDFVIASASTAADVEMKQTLEIAGITVAYFDVDTFYDYLSMLDICTDITGRKDLYEQNGIKVKEEIEKIKDKFSEANLPDEKRTILLLRTSSSLLKAKGSEGTVLGEMLCDLGCINIADNDKSLLDNLSVESIIWQEPYRIFAVAMGDETAAQKNLSKTMEENPAWGKLDAVENGRLHIMDRKLFNLKPNANWAKAYEQLVEILLREQ